MKVLIMFIGVIATGFGTYFNATEHWKSAAISWNIASACGWCIIAFL